MVSTLIDDNPGTFAVLRMHIWEDAAHDYLETPWGNQRLLFYDVGSSGVPWFAYDGLFDAWPINTYASKLAQRQAVPTDVTIDLWGVETSAQTYDLTAEVCIEAGGAGKTMTVYMVEVLDHYPATPTYYRNTLRQAATTEDVTLAEGECAQVTRTFVFDTTSWAQQTDIKIIAWAQTPAAAYPAEVHQAAETAWPFSGGAPDPPIFEDGFESGDTTMWSSDVP